MVASLVTLIIWFGKKSTALENAKKFNNPILLARDIKYDQNIVKQFGVIEQNALLNFYKNNQINDNHLYSSVSDELGQIPKLFIDFDLSRDDVSEDIWNVFVENFKNIPKLLHKFLQYHINIFWPDAELPKARTFASVKEDGTYNKISLHMHYNIAFPALYDFRQYITKCIDGYTDFVFPEWYPFKSLSINVNGKIKRLYDPSVYSHGVFRMPFQSKLDSDCKLIPLKKLKNNDFMTDIWTHTLNGFDCEKLEYNDKIKQQLADASPITFINTKYRTPIIKLEAEHNCQFLLKIIPAEEQNRGTIAAVFAAVKNIAKSQSVVMRNILMDSVITWSITDRFVEDYGMDACYNYMEKQYNDTVPNGTIGLLLTLARIYQPDVSITGKDLDISADLSDIYDSVCNNIKNIDIDSEYVKPLEWNDSKTMIIRSCMGSGKSSRIREWIYTLPASTSILFITNRRVLASELFAQYKDHGFTHYESIKHDKIYNRIIIQLESLTKIIAKPTYDVVIVDECESLINQLFSSTHKDKLFDNSTIFTNYIINADKVICMDAFVAKRTFALCRATRNNDTIQYLRYLRNPRQRHIEVYKGNNNKINPALFQRMSRDILAGKRAYIWSGSATQIDALYNHILLLGVKADKILKLNGKMSAKDKTAIFTDVNKSWKQYDYVLATPVITVGCNFDADHFDTAYIIHNTRSTCVRDAIQAMMRCRQLKSNIIHFQVENTTASDNDVAVVQNTTACVYALDESVGNWYKQLHADMIKEQALSNKYPMLTLLKLLQEGIFAVHINNDDITDEERNEIRKLIRKNRKTVDISAYRSLWRCTKFNYDNNHILFDDVALTQAITDCDNHCEDDAAKDLADRFYFQRLARYSPVWNSNKPEELTELYNLFCSNGLYRDYLRASTAIPKYADKFEPNCDADFNKSIYYVIRIREQFISFFLKLQHKNISINALFNGQTTEFYKEFANMVVILAIHFGQMTRFQREQIKQPENLKPFQIINLFNATMQLMRAGFEIQKITRASNGIRTHIYELYNGWESWTRSSHHYIAGIELPALERECRQFWLNTFRKSFRDITAYGFVDDENDTGHIYKFLKPINK